MGEMSVAWELLQHAVALYLKAFGLYLTVLIPLTVVYMVSKPNTRLNYYLWFFTTFFFILFLMGFIMPVLLFRPRTSINANIATWIFRKWSYVIGLTIEVRGSNVMKEELKNSGAIICCNHQSALDLFGEFINTNMCLFFSYVNFSFQFK